MCDKPEVDREYEYLCPECGQRVTIAGYPPKEGRFAYCVNNNRHSSIFIQFPIAHWPPHLIREKARPFVPRTGPELYEEWGRTPDLGNLCDWTVTESRRDIVKMLNERADASTGPRADHYSAATFAEAARLVEELK